MYIHPFLQNLTQPISRNAKMTFLLIFMVYLLIDFTITVRHVSTLNGRLDEIQAALNGFFGKYYKRAEDFKNAIIVSFEESEFYSERIKMLFNLDKFQNRRLIRAFPKLRSFQYDDALKKLRARVLGRKDNSNDE